MPHDLFISYSRADSGLALELAERLRTSGRSVWIDQMGIEGANSWSKEIANALEACQAMLLLISPRSVESANVAKELAVATMLQKRIVPVQIERVELKGEFLYHLASLQRVKIADFDGIVRAISATQPDIVRAQPVPSRPVDNRKSLMILPFQDLSPTADNEWFADGIVNELIASLSHVKSLRVTDKQTTTEYKRYSGQLASYASQMNVRYFVQGDVRKFGDQIKISCSLLDIETGDHLWQASHKGTMNDIFDMQEDVARKVVEGLKVHLVPAEDDQLAKRGTNNPEAYEMYLKAEQYFDKNTKIGIEYAIKAIDRALELDPEFTKAMLRRAIILTGYFRLFGGTDTLNEAEALLEKAKQRTSAAEDWRVLGGAALIAMARNQLVEAEALLRENLAIDPSDPYRRNAIAFFFYMVDRFPEAIEQYEAIVEAKPESYREARQLLACIWSMERPDLYPEYSRRYIHLVLSRVQTMPDDEDAATLYATMLHYLGRDDEAREQLDLIRDEHLSVIHSFRYVAYIAAQLGQPERAIRVLKLAVANTFRAEHPGWLDAPELDSLRDREDFIELRQDWARRATQSR